MKVVDETAAAVSVAAEEKNVNDIEEALGGTKRRFFPRVKHLLTREWESVSLLMFLDSLDFVKAMTTPWHWSIAQL